MGQLGACAEIAFNCNQLLLRYVTKASPCNRVSAVQGARYAAAAKVLLSSGSVLFSNVQCPLSAEVRLFWLLYVDAYAYVNPCTQHICQPTVACVPWFSSLVCLVLCLCASRAHLASLATPQHGPALTSLDAHASMWHASKHASMWHILIGPFVRPPNLSSTLHANMGRAHCDTGSEDVHQRGTATAVSHARVCCNHNGRPFSCHGHLPA